MEAPLLDAPGGGKDIRSRWGLSRLQLFLLFQLYTAGVMAFTWTHVGFSGLGFVMLLYGELLATIYWKANYILSISSVKCGNKCLTWFPLILMVFSVYTSLLFIVVLGYKQSLLTKAHVAIGLATSCSFPVVWLADWLVQEVCGENRAPSSFLARTSGRELAEAAGVGAEGEVRSATVESIRFISKLLLLLTVVFVFSAYCVFGSISEAPYSFCARNVHTASQLNSAAAGSGVGKFIWIGTPQFVELMWPAGIRRMEQDGTCIVLPIVSARGVARIVGSALVTVALLLTATYIFSCIVAKLILMIPNLKEWYMWVATHLVKRCTIGLGFLCITLIPLIKPRALRHPPLGEQENERVILLTALLELVVLNMYTWIIAKLYEGLKCGNDSTAPKIENCEEKI